MLRVLETQSTALLVGCQCESYLSPATHGRETRDAATEESSPGAASLVKERIVDRKSGPRPYSAYRFVGDGAGSANLPPPTRRCRQKGTPC
jgi:hypothetical protein